MFGGVRVYILWRLNLCLYLRCLVVAAVLKNMKKCLLRSLCYAFPAVLSQSNPLITPSMQEIAYRLSQVKLLMQQRPLLPSASPDRLQRRVPRML